MSEDKMIPRPAWGRFATMDAVHSTRLLLAMAYVSRVGRQGVG